MLVSLVHRGDQVVLVRPLVLDHRVVHAFQVLLEVQVVHHVLPYQVHLEVEVVEVGAGGGGGGGGGGGLKQHTLEHEGAHEDGHPYPHGLASLL